MRVSGFTFVRNAVDLGYPLVESITSALPLCDEFIVAAGDSVDDTTAVVRAIDPVKIRVVETTWDERLFVKGAVFAQQTDRALSECRGAWALYLQADEVLHERDLPRIATAMQRYATDPRVEGLVVDYLHFWGDYAHVQTSHNWYRREVRVVRTGIGVASWGDAQGFRLGGRKLGVAHANATVYHYGHVRPPQLQRRKQRAFDTAYVGAAAIAATPETPYRYGRLSGWRPFEGTHPRVMHERIARQDWTVERSAPAGFKHDRFRVRVATHLENLIGRRIGERRNYELLPGMGPEREQGLPPVRAV